MLGPLVLQYSDTTLISKPGVKADIEVMRTGPHIVFFMFTYIFRPKIVSRSVWLTQIKQQHFERFFVSKMVAS